MISKHSPLFFLFWSTVFYSTWSTHARQNLVKCPSERRPPKWSSGRMLVFFDWLILIDWAGKKANPCRSCRVCADQIGPEREEGSVQTEVRDDDGRVGDVVVSQATVRTPTVPQAHGDGALARRQCALRAARACDAGDSRHVVRTEHVHQLLLSLLCCSRCRCSENDSSTKITLCDSFLFHFCVE